MGTGKSTVGKYLAKKMGKPFLDTDSMIECREGISINKIFINYGEGYFRNLENTLIKEICNKQNVVVSTGGGTLLSEDNFQSANSCGIVFLLWAKPAIIMERLKKEADIRPLLSGANRLEKISLLLDQRKEKYNRFKYQIDTSELSVSEVASKIMDIVDMYGKEAK